MMEKENHPITGICSFGKYPIAADLDNLKADVGVLGVPYDLGVGFLSGTRFGPRRIREASTQYGRGTRGYYDPDYDEVFLGAPWRIVDCGDADIVNGDVDASFNSIEESVRSIVRQGVTPAIMGGDHSISIPIAQALDDYTDLTVIQLDAHLDWSMGPGGKKKGNGSPMRRMSEMNHIKKMAQIGLRGIGSSMKEDFEEARSFGSTLVTAKEAKKMGMEAVTKRIPPSAHYYVTIDIDVCDITLAPGTGSPMPGGFHWEELNQLLELIAHKGNVVAFDLVEVAPQYDPAGTTCRVAAMIMLNFIGHILKKREIEA